MADAITKKKDEPKPDWDPKLETAPSLEREDEPSLARTIGLCGTCAITVGGLALLIKAMGITERVGVGTASVIVLLGLVGLLTHAAFESELQLRRIYWGLGIVLIGKGMLFAFIRAFSEGGTIYFIGVLGRLFGLFFIIAALRHETSEPLRRFSLRLIGILGLVWAGIALLFGHNFTGQFLMPQGTILALLGLVYLITFVNHHEEDDEWALRGSWAIGGIGATFVLVGLLRSLFQSGYFLPEGLVYCSLGLPFIALFVGQRSDKPFVVLLRRELSAFIVSPIFYILLIGVTAIGWISYYVWFRRVASNIVEEPVIRLFFDQIFAIGVTCMVPILTMRLLSEEKRSGTLEQLLTVPLKESTLVLSKFFAGLILFLLMWMPVFLYIAAARIMGGESFEYQPLFGFLVVLLATGAHFIGIGLFFSGVTKNQIAAAVLAFAYMLLLLLVPLLLLPSGSRLGALAQHLNYFGLWRGAFAGTFSVQQLLPHLSLAVLWIYVTIQVLASRRWK